MTMSPIGYGKRGSGRKKLKKVGAGKKGTSHKVKASLNFFNQKNVINKWMKEK